MLFRESHDHVIVAGGPVAGRSWPVIDWLNGGLGFGPEDVAEFNKGKEFVGVTPVVADRPLKGLIEEMGDPSQFLEHAYRSLQQATIPH